PGDAGPALVAGHVDSRSGPGVFFRLGEVQVGDRVEVARADGSTVAFTVTGRFDTPKAAFPTELVYAPTPGPELRLVTCGGSFDRATGHYRDNIVVEAVLADGAEWTIS
ncbi:MAG: class F sortase, partial [Pseudonocardia sp.]|nr:class F sortase [Pseudonocardia sp.]